MRALVATRPGHTNAFDLLEVPRPVPGADEVLIRVQASTINRVDLVILSGFMHSAGYIADGVVSGIGNDVAGVVAGVGAAVTEFSSGDRVAGEVPAWRVPGQYGAHADYVVMPASAIAKIPETLGFTEAATVPLNGLTAHQALVAIPPSVRSRLLVTGAAGAVGGYATALAARAGWEVTALARLGDDEFVRRAGARHLATSIDGIGRFDAVLDAAGLGTSTIALLRDGGFYSGIGAAVGAIAEERGITVSEIHTRPDGRQVAELLALAAAGDLEIRIAGTVTLDAAAHGFEQVESGTHRGRWVIVA